MQVHHALVPSRIQQQNAVRHRYGSEVHIAGHFPVAPATENQDAEHVAADAEHADDERRVASDGRGQSVLYKLCTRPAG